LTGAPTGAAITRGGVFTWTPTEAQGPGTYTFDVIVSDGQGGADSETLTVTVLEDNADPVIVSDGAGPTASITIAENHATVTIVEATDGDVPSQNLTYSIIGGADSALFRIDAITGELGFLAEPDFEAPIDVDGNNIYDVIVEVSDGGGGTDQQAIAVTISNAMEASVGGIVDIDSAPNQVMEDAGQGAVVGITANAQDTDATDIVHYSLIDDAGGRFEIDPDSGVVTVAEPGLIDYEASQSHTIKVLASSSDGSSSTLSITIQIGNANDLAPELNLGIISLTQGASVTVSGDILDARDPDGLAQSLTFRVGNVVAGRFELTTTPGIAITYFDQADLLAGHVLFVHDGSNRAPSFEVSVSDDRFTTGPMSALIHFNYVDTSVTDHPPDTPEPPSEDTPNSPNDQGTGSGESETPTGPGDTEDVVISKPSKPDPLGEALLDNDLETRLSPPSPRSSVVDVPVMFARIGSHGDTAIVRVSSVEQIRLMLSNNAQVDTEQGGAGDHPITHAMPRIDEQEQGQTFEIARDAARLAGLAFSVGAVWWAIRIGGLMASLMATIPAWRQFDPLPILRHKAELDDPGKWLEEDIATDTHMPENLGVDSNTNKVSMP
jgi:hypothetical protein